MGVDGESNGFITVLDDSDDPKVDLILSTTIQAAKADSDETATLRLLPDEIDLPLKPKSVATNGEANGAVDAEPEPVLDMPGSGTKRKREAEDEVESVAKKAKATNENVYVVEDDGAILLDDD